MSFILINRDNYIFNLNQICKRVDKTKIAVVLKDNAYGHGIVEIAKIANKFGIKRAIVRNSFEAKIVENLFENIVILADINVTSSKFEVAINSIEQLRKIDKNIKIHLKFDSGMHRSGIGIDELDEAISIIKLKELNLVGFFTHFRSGDELSSELFWQMENFKNAKEKIKVNFNNIAFHSCNSSSLFRLKTIEDDFVRVGIATYGYLENDYLFKDIELKPVLSLWAEKISSRELKAGSKVGYGGAYKLDINSTISNYDIGYGDGFFRVNERKKIFLKNGLEILGRVSMDSFSIKSNEERVCLFDDVRDLAKEFDTISYDILVKLSPTIKRVVI